MGGGWRDPRRDADKAKGPIRYRVSLGLLQAKLTWKRMTESATSWSDATAPCHSGGCHSPRRMGLRGSPPLDRSKRGWCQRRRRKGGCRGLRGLRGLRTPPGPPQKAVECCPRSDPLRPPSPAPCA
eukprot:817054-Prorocentrum_minimum.AAC.1